MVTPMNLTRLICHVLSIVIPIIVLWASIALVVGVTVLAGFIGWWWLQ